MIDNQNIISGTDEAGRGCCAGPLVAASVILKPNHNIIGLNDSKLLSPKLRKILYDQIIDNSVDYKIAIISPQEIDEINIFQATLKAMATSIEGLKTRPTLALIDGPYPPAVTIATRAIISGDRLSPIISAASILAKVYRDQLMQTYALDYPQYGFDRHKGYQTKEHLFALNQYGPCLIHRKTWKTISSLC